MSDFLDVPPKFCLSIPLTYGDRINADCYDPHHCTIANGILRGGAKLGITALGRRGVSRWWVGMRFDPKVYRWAKPHQDYRARLTDESARIAAELDDWLDRPMAHKAFKAALRKAALREPNGLDTVWRTVVIKAPPPSLAKGYRAGQQSGSQSGPRAPVSGAPSRRYTGWVTPVNP